MGDDNPLNLVEFAGSKAIIGGQDDGVKPKLRLIAGCFDMNMGRFLPFVTEKVEAEPSDA